MPVINATPRTPTDANKKEAAQNCSSPPLPSAEKRAAKEQAWLDRISSGTSKSKHSRAASNGNGVSIKLGPAAVEYIRPSDRGSCSGKTSESAFFGLWPSSERQKRHSRQPKDDSGPSRDSIRAAKSSKSPSATTAGNNSLLIVPEILTQQSSGSTRTMNSSIRAGFSAIRWRISKTHDNAFTTRGKGDSDLPSSGKLGPERHAYAAPSFTAVPASPYALRPQDDTPFASSSYVHLPSPRWETSEQPSPTRIKQSITQTTTSHDRSHKAASTMAQQLQALESANTAGILSDDDYRALKQNIFKHSVKQQANPIVSAETVVRSTDMQRHPYNVAEFQEAENAIGHTGTLLGLPRLQPAGATTRANVTFAAEPKRSRTRTTEEQPHKSSKPPIAVHLSKSTPSLRSQKSTSVTSLLSRKSSKPTFLASMFGRKDQDQIENDVQDEADEAGSVTHDGPHIAQGLNASVPQDWKMLHIQDARADHSTPFSTFLPTNTPQLALQPAAMAKADGKDAFTSNHPAGVLQHQHSRPSPEECNEVISRRSEPDKGFTPSLLSPPMSPSIIRHASQASTASSFGFSATTVNSTPGSPILAGTLAVDTSGSNFLSFSSSSSSSTSIVSPTLPADYDQFQRNPAENWSSAPFSVIQPGDEHLSADELKRAIQATIAQKQAMTAQFASFEAAMEADTASAGVFPRRKQSTREHPPARHDVQSYLSTSTREGQTGPSRQPSIMGSIRSSFSRRTARNDVHSVQEGTRPSDGVTISSRMSHPWYASTEGDDHHDLSPSGAPQLPPPLSASSLLSSSSQLSQRADLVSKRYDARIEYLELQLQSRLIKDALRR